MKTKKKIIAIKTKLGQFNCLFDPNSPEKGYTVTVPDMKGVVTFGDNLNEAKRNAKEAIELHGDCLLEKGLARIQVLPKARAKEVVRV